MKFGIWVDSAIPEGNTASRASVLNETLDIVEFAESLGFDGCWFAEHHYTEEGYDPSPLIMSAMSARRTSQVELGTSILLLPLHHPVHVAEAASIISQTTGRTFNLGVGLGYHLSEFAGMGINRRERPSRMEEGLSVIASYLKGEPFSFSGQHYDLQDVRPVFAGAAGGVRLWVGARGPIPSVRAGRHGCSLLVASSQSAYDDYVDALLEAGHDPADRGVAVMRTVHVADSTQHAWDRCGSEILYESKVARRWFAKAGDLPGDRKPPIETLADRRPNSKFVGSSADIIADLHAVRKRFTREVPMEWFIINPRPALLDLDTVKDSLTRFATEVIPEFAQ